MDDKANAKELIKSYESYLHQLVNYLPKYGKLCDFLDKEPCKCSGLEGDCCCKKNHQVCSCVNEENQVAEGGCQCLHSICRCGFVEDIVRVYVVSTTEKTIKPDEYHPRDFDDLENLRKKIQEQKNKENVFCLICVSHLSPNVAKMLGKMYNISADFFNRHLPGTEPLSGKLLSALPSSVQIEFDELYESEETFEELWPKLKIMDGHDLIRRSMERHFLFRSVGWDYYPIEKEDFKESWNNSRMSSGYEVRSQQPQLKNVFQFNVSHRVSVYSIPAKAPKTALIIFYPTVPIFSDKRASEEELKRQLEKHDCTEKWDRVKFRPIPKAAPTPSDAANLAEETNRCGIWKEDFATTFHRELVLHVEKHFKQLQAYESSQAERLAKLAGGSFIPRGGHPAAGQKETDAEPQSADISFVHLFAAPLFQMIAANWARLIVRRSFDLDLLEWRPTKRLNATVINEIKSRRIAIARHQRDLNASLDIIHPLMLEEQGQKVTREELSQASHAGDVQPRQVTASVLQLAQNEPQWNRGRVNGLVAETPGDDTWERIYWDFYELKAQMDALSNRADKIHDGFIGLIQVKESEIAAEQSLSAGRLNKIAFAISVVIIPFTVISTIYTADLMDKTEHLGRRIQVFIEALFGTLGGMLVLAFPASFFLWVSSGIYRRLVKGIRTWVKNRPAVQKPVKKFKTWVETETEDMWDSPEGVEDTNNTLEAIRSRHGKLCKEKAELNGVNGVDHKECSMV